MNASGKQHRSELAEVARLFLKLGLIGFGGPAAHIAMMEREVVQKRKWFTQAYFLDLVGATNLIPGPNSTEMAMHCGMERAGWKGLLVAGCCFIFPAVILTGIIAWAYHQYGQLPEVAPFIYGIKPAIIAVIVSLMISLGKKAFSSVQLIITGIIVAALALWGINEIILLFAAGAAGIIVHLAKKRSHSATAFFPLVLLQIGANLPVGFDWKLFWIFLKTGAILYGSGYVLFALLDADLVSTHLLTRQQLTDAIAVGQFTPGPVFSSATFIGWQLSGLSGAIAATIGIFLPSFLFVGLLNPLIPYLRKSPAMAAFLNTVNAASVALILAICLEMGKLSISDWRTLLIAILGFAVLLSWPAINTAFIVLGGALAGYLLALI
ncbi:chromate efflux transporter [Paraflavitalea sp. CAU 1676]|uniref:chromate efflux transporter n=1 Tax=Paraflavitalea sp. CAU 1676 TaxID=3032598 RepID=UPI0023DB0BD6|nr:chromate efflux transporter [Paraflavitalea sp. CAU 1676]MDF2187857.1 chromate efflux transporter [Paraflavitalea sp. CAU 1676]